MPRPSKGITDGGLCHLEQQGGVGKVISPSTTRQRVRPRPPQQRVLVVDMCPQANSSGMLLGGIVAGERQIEALAGQTPPRTISGYIADRIVNPYSNPHTGANYLTHVQGINRYVPNNLYLVCGDEELEFKLRPLGRRGETVRRTHGSLFILGSAIWWMTSATHGTSKR